jgi:hypothetical protein
MRGNWSCSSTVDRLYGISLLLEQSSLVNSPSRGPSTRYVTEGYQEREREQNPTVLLWEGQAPTVFLWVGKGPTNSLTKKVFRFQQSYDEMGQAPTVLLWERVQIPTVLLWDGTGSNSLTMREGTGSNSLNMRRDRFQQPFCYRGQAPTVLFWEGTDSNNSLTMRVYTVQWFQQSYYEMVQVPTILSREG